MRFLPSIDLESRRILLKRAAAVAAYSLSIVVVPPLFGAIGTHEEDVALRSGAANRFAESMDLESTQLPEWLALLRTIQTKERNQRMVLQELQRDIDLIRELLKEERGTVLADQKLNELTFATSNLGAVHRTVEYELRSLARNIVEEQKRHEQRHAALQEQISLLEQDQCDKLCRQIDLKLESTSQANSIRQYQREIELKDQEIANLRQHIASLRTQLKRARGSLQEERNNLEELQSAVKTQVDEAKRAVMSHSTTSSDRDSQVTALRNQLTMVKQQAREAIAQARAQRAEAVQGMSEQLTSFQEEVERREKESLHALAAAKDLVNSYAALYSKQEESLRLIGEQMRQALGGGAGSGIAVGETPRLRAEALTEQLITAYSSVRGQHQNDTAMLSEQLSSSTQESASAKEKLKSAREGIQCLSASYDHALVNAGEMAGQLRQLKEENRTITDQLTTARQTVEILQGQYNEVYGLTDENRSLREAVENLRFSLAALDNELEQERGTRERIEDQLQEAVNANKQIAAEKESLLSLADDAASSHALRDQVISMAQQNESLHNQVAELCVNCDTLNEDRGALVNRVQELSQESSALQAEKEALNSQIVALQRSFESVASERNQVAEQLRQAGDEYSVLQNQHARVSDQLNTAYQTCCSLSEEQEQLQNHNKELSGRYQSAVEQHDALNEQLGRLRLETNLQQKKKEALSQALKQSDALCYEQQCQISEADELVSRLSVANNNLRNRLHATEEQIATHAAMRDQLAQHVSDLNEGHISLSERAEMLNEHLGSARWALSNSEEEKRALSDQLQNEQQNCSEVTAELTATRARLEDLEKRYQSVVAQLKAGRQ